MSGSEGWTCTLHQPIDYQHGSSWTQISWFGRSSNCHQIDTSVALVQIQIPTASGKMTADSSCTITTSKYINELSLLAR
jgi:hypothetical protein